MNERLTADCEYVEVLIVGSGPVGATFARCVAEGDATASILMLDAGPQISSPAGLSARNLPDEGQFDAACRAAEGADPDLAPGDRAKDTNERRPFSTLARSGTHLLAAIDPDEADTMPAAAMTTCVGGMTAFWTCATPRPMPEEIAAFLPAEAWSEAIARAEGLLGSAPDVFTPSWQSDRVLAALKARRPGWPDERLPRMMPFAARRMADGTYRYSGVDGVLGDLADRLADPAAQVRLRARTLCQRLVHTNGRVAGAIVTDLETGRTYGIRARIVIVAADALRGPQLLWASGIRPPALGRHLNEHAMIMSRMVLHAPAGDTADPMPAPARRLTPLEAMTTVMWAPLFDPHHPIHGQIAHFDEMPADAERLADEGYDISGAIGLTHFCRKEIDARDRIEFDDTRLDAFGMPAGRITYKLTARDHTMIARAQDEQRALVAELGTFLPSEEPRAMPVGTSLHYQGTLRMGERDDGTSVCDPASKVWDTENLFVGGNGVIPTATACNPTLYSVTLAVLAAQRVVADLEHRSADHAAVEC